MVGNSQAFWKLFAELSSHLYFVNIFVIKLLWFWYTVEGLSVWWPVFNVHDMWVWSDKYEALLGPIRAIPRRDLEFNVGRKFPNRASYYLEFKSRDLEFKNRNIEFQSRDLEFQSRDLEFQDYYGMALIELRR